MPRPGDEEVRPVPGEEGNRTGRARDAWGQVARKRRIERRGVTAIDMKRYYAL